MQNSLTMLSGKSRLEKHETPIPRKDDRRRFSHRLQGTPVLCWQGHCQRGAAPTQCSQRRPASPRSGCPEASPLGGQCGQAQANTTRPGILQTYNTTVESPSPPPEHLLIFFPAPLANSLLNTNGPTP